MLRSLYVKDFAVVDEAEIGFDQGLTVVTGETGAGKSLLVDALLLLAGGRADAAMVRHGCERAELSAEFDLDGHPELARWLREEELDEDGACQVRRVIRAEGSSRAWINGRPVTLAQLKTLGAGLVEIHGQHEHQALLDRHQQLALLDAFGRHEAERAAVAETARAWRDVGARIGALPHGEDAAARIEWLEHQVAELEAHALAPSELEALEHEHRRLANAGQLVQGAAGIGESLDGDGEYALTRVLGRAQYEATRLAGLDPRLGDLVERLAEARIQLEEAADALSRYRDGLDLDPERLAEIDDRLARLHELARKHRRPMAELAAHGAHLREELDILRGAGTALAKLQRERENQAAAWATASKALTAARHRAADGLGAAVAMMLGELGMGKGRFEVVLEATDGNEPTPLGAERCEFLVSANPGQPPRPLRKIASGGELSRISLAIEVAALGLDEVGTMVFDEVDSGIGGAIAEVVGQKLRRLGSQRQVLCVTHLAQVAAQGHAHLKVSKSSDTAQTHTRIDRLDENARVDELARMLGGIEITATTRAHASQMLAQAQNQR
ncbi:DNA repair protein RecN [Dokdonella sp.]|uniref:DNA repair protein RecN n=1 Tax=Dokdonella sp. TaxID=2291710 RepID=UPI0025B969E2|nr:DNA repair protein RecN [Dokdonella sp.]MBX3693308.1 DNA repair protein RecN [Dokdonella sp.]